MDFFDKYRDIDHCVHCGTHEEATAFLGFLDENGRRWCTDERYDSHDRWNDYRSDTVYYFNKGKFGSRNLAVRSLVLEYKDVSHYWESDLTESDLPVEFLM